MDKLNQTTGEVAREESLFKNGDRAAYEITHLLRTMPDRLLVLQGMTIDQTRRAEALRTHAETASSTLLGGIEAIGHLIAAAADSENFSLSKSTLMDLGMLITHAAVEAHAMLELEADCGYALNHQRQFPQREGSL